MYNQYNPTRNVTNTHKIDQEKWSITLARKKKGRGEYHAFLILDGLSNDNTYILKRIDLFFDLGKEKKSSELSGKALISIKDIDADKLQDLKNNCICKTWGITADQATLFLQKIDEDVKKGTSYNTLGNGSCYAVSFPEEYENCISWAEAKLKEIKINNPDANAWVDFICVHPKLHVPEINERRCIIL